MVIQILATTVVPTGVTGKTIAATAKAAAHAANALVRAHIDLVAIRATKVLPLGVVCTLTGFVPLIPTTWHFICFAAAITVVPMGWNAWT